MLQIHNTLTNKLEEFKPLKKGLVSMYHCGPTVYDYPHIGNLRSYFFADILRRTLEANDFTTHQVINITDIGHLASDSDEGEDKMTKGLKREGKPLTLEAMKELGSFYTEKFTENIKALNIMVPHDMPRASENIQGDIELISTLEKKGFVYKIEGNGMYFDTSKFPEYGKLGNIKPNLDEEFARVIPMPLGKRNFIDFAVWKFNNKLGFPSPWGQGFPGWHIECSVMSMKYLGETFDIHTGGIDHIPVHHNNEIAQSESATGKPFVNYWLHHGHIIINNEKMAKSIGNYLTLPELSKQGIDPLAYRYWLLGAHYRTQMNFTDEAITGAQNAYKKFITAFQNLGLNHSSGMVGLRASGTPGLARTDKSVLGEASGTILDNYYSDFLKFVNNDLNTPQALALAWDLLKDPTVSDPDKRGTLLAFDSILGLNLQNITQDIIPQEVTLLVEERELARKNKDWKKSDEIRNIISGKGYRVKDTDAGPLVTKL